MIGRAHRRPQRLRRKRIRAVEADQNARRAERVRGAQDRSEISGVLQAVEHDDQPVRIPIRTAARRRFDERAHMLRGLGGRKRFEHALADRDGFDARKDGRRLQREHGSDPRAACDRIRNELVPFDQVQAGFPARFGVLQFLRRFDALVASAGDDHFSLLRQKATGEVALCYFKDASVASFDLA